MKGLTGFEDLSLLMMVDDVAGRRGLSVIEVQAVRKVYLSLPIHQQKDISELSNIYGYITGDTRPVDYQVGISDILSDEQVTIWKKVLKLK